MNMISKVRERQKAIELRRKGYSYKDILDEVPVSKSSLSLWLKDLPLTEDEKRHLKRKKDSNITRGRIRAAASLRMRRVIKDKFLFRDSLKEFSEHKNDPFFHIGVALYWAEGAKRNWGFSFINSDAEMMNLMIAWIESFLRVKRDQIRARLFTHLPFSHERQEEFWSVETGIPLENFKKTVYKPTGLLVKKKPEYKGCLRIELSKSDYLRKLKFWQKMLIEYHTKAR